MFAVHRRLALAEENRELARIVRLAKVFKDIFTAVATFKGNPIQYLADFSYTL